MQFFRRMSPVAAYRDLRAFLSGSQPYKLWFLAGAVVLAGVVVGAFTIDSRVVAPYKPPTVIYVHTYMGDPPEADVLARLKVEKAKKDKELAEEKRIEDARRASFQRAQDQMNRLGL